MTESFGYANLCGFLLLGPALLWSTRILYGRRVLASDDAMRRCLVLAAWVLIALGGLGVISLFARSFSMLAWGGVLVVGGLAVRRYRASERRALLWFLSAAAEKGLPLHEAVRAFAEDRSDEIGLRAARLADLLQQGVLLPEALKRSDNPAPLEIDLAARVGIATGQLGPALKSVARHEVVVRNNVQSALLQLGYLLSVCFAFLLISTFLMWKIVPTFKRMFDEFGIELPEVTVWLMSVSEVFVDYAFLFVLFVPLFMVIVALMLLFWAGSLSWGPRLGTTWLRIDGAVIMRSMALCVRQRRDLPETLRLLSWHFPNLHTRHRLARIADDVEQGGSWTLGLRSASLISPADAAVLNAAQRAGNLPWALEEMADSALRRAGRRLHVVASLCTPLMVILLGFAVLFYCTALFLPLVKLIENLV